MSAARAAAGLIAAASIAAAALAPSADRPAPAALDGFRVVTADLHVHAFPGDGALMPWDLRREARRRGLDAIAITNHNQMVGISVDRLLFSGPQPAVMLPGVELTAPRFHLSVIGVREPVEWRLPLPEAIRAVHAQGGVAIAAHAVGKYASEIDDHALALLDGIEVAHPVTVEDPGARAELDALFDRAVRLNPTIAAVGSSDYHFGAPMGSRRTRLFVRELSVDGILDAIRAGRTVAIDEDGRQFGQQPWLHLAESSPEPRQIPDHWIHRVTMPAAWISLVALVALGGRRRAPLSGS